MALQTGRASPYKQAVHDPTNRGQKNYLAGGTEAAHHYFSMDQTSLTTVPIPEGRSR
jgi:hypothetical protein